MMPSIVKILRVIADPNRLRILLLLKTEELSVAELQEILVMGQSTISTHLSQLKQAGLVEDRRTGKNNLYSLTTDLEGGKPLDEILSRAQSEARAYPLLPDSGSRGRSRLPSLLALPAGGRPRQPGVARHLLDRQTCAPAD